MLRVGVIGAGNYGINHIKNVAELDFAEVCAISDKNLKTALKVQETYGGKAYSSAEEMLEKENIDACFISVPPFVHGEPELLAIDKGIPICVDKPLSNKLNIALKIENLLSSKGIINSIGYQYRYFDIVSKVKEIIQGSNVIFCTGHWLSRFPEDSMSWWGRKKYSGGQLIEQATHLFDLVRYLFGEPSHMQSFSNPNFPNNDKIDIESASSVNMIFDSGMIVNISCACALPVRYKCGFTIMTDNEVLELVSVKSGMMNVMLNIINKDGKQTIYPKKDPVKELDRTFLQAVQNNDQSVILSPYSDAIKTLKLTIDASKNV